MIKKIVIIGGGFAGFNLAKCIKNKNYHITLVDRNNYFFFPPLLYQVATGFLEPSNISYPYRKMLRKKRNIRFKLGEVIRVEPEENKILISTGELLYDYLVIATGTETNYFGLDNVKEKAIPMKNLNDSLNMRNYLLNQLERATSFVNDNAKVKRTLTIVVAGGGPTGVEISGLLAEMKKYILTKDYPELSKVKSSIFLVDGASQLLTPMSIKSQENTYNELKKMGIKIILNAQVKDFKNNIVYLSNGKTIDTENLIWAAGVVSQKFKGFPIACYGSGNRLITDEFNKVIGLKNVYAIGDTCIQNSDNSFPNGHPQVAQVALQQGKNLAYNFNQIFVDAKQRPFKYNDKGSMAIIGRNKAVADLPPNFHFKGFVAWLIWIFIHLFSLVHFRNKLTTLYNWVISYFTKDQALRMIIRPFEKNKTE
ncbi:MAG: NAD(P)/FAD-dependent oxidoreductase [Bacteroidia bacterium]|nr:NAD(P)/FAD-dependent oxidoreductase [Bacteroidia bacterium]